MGKIIKNYMYNTFYQILVLIVPLVTAPYLSRVLGAESLGIYGYISSATSVISTVGLLGIYSYGNREAAYVREDKSKLSKIFWELMILRFVLLIITSLVFIIIIIRTEYKFYFSLYYIWLLATFLDISWLFVGLEDMRPAVIKNSFAKLISIVGIFFFVKDEKDLWLYVLFMVGSTFIANISVYPIIPRYIDKIKFKVDFHSLKRHLRESLYLFLPQVATTIYLQIDKIMIEQFTGSTSNVGYYLQAEKIINIPLALLTGLSTVMMPRIANEFKKGNKSKINKYIVKSATFTIMISIPMSVGIAIIAPDFVPWFLGNGFGPTVNAVIILSPLIILNSLGGIASQQYFTATNQLKLLFFTNAVGTILNIILNLTLIPKIGFLGAAFSSVISLTISVFFQYYYLFKQLNINEIFKNLLKYGLFALIMGVIIYILGLFTIFGELDFIIQIVSGTVIYIILLIISNDSNVKFLLTTIGNIFMVDRK